MFVRSLSAWGSYSRWSTECAEHYVDLRCMLDCHCLGLMTPISAILWKSCTEGKYALQYCWSCLTVSPILVCSGSCVGNPRADDAFSGVWCRHRSVIQSQRLHLADHQLCIHSGVLPHSEGGHGYDGLSSIPLFLTTFHEINQVKQSVSNTLNPLHQARRVNIHEYYSAPNLTFGDWLNLKYISLK